MCLENPCTKWQDEARLQQAAPWWVLSEEDSQAAHGGFRGPTKTTESNSVKQDF